MFFDVENKRNQQILFFVLGAVAFLIYCFMWFRFNGLGLLLCAGNINPGSGEFSKILLLILHGFFTPPVILSIIIEGLIFFKNPGSISYAKALRMAFIGKIGCWLIAWPLLSFFHAYPLILLLFPLAESGIIALVFGYNIKQLLVPTFLGNVVTFSSIALFIWLIISTHSFCICC